MAIIKCAKGHFFDNGKYSECPYCANMLEERNRYTEQIRDSVTVSMPRRQEPSAENVTIGLYDPVPKDDGKTIGVFTKKMGREYVTGWLVCTEGREKGRDYRLHNGYNQIGRSLQMDICVVDDPGISRDNHASIVYDYRSNRFFIAPSGGVSTRLNGEEIIRPRELHARDVLGIGESEFVFIPFCGGDYTWDQKEKD